MVRTLAAAAVLAFATAGCGSEDEPTSAASPTTTPASAAAYVEKVNARCEALIDDVVPVTGNDAPLPTRTRFVENTAKLAAVYEAFDAEVAAITTSNEAEEEARRTFTAYLAALHAMDEKLTAQVEDLSEAAWGTEVEAAYDALFVSPERTAMIALGITCPAR